MKESELTCEAKDAIRAYILKIVALPGVFVTVISFLLGYGIRDIAAKNAELQASQQLSSAITNALAKSQAAEEKLKQAEDIAARIKNLQVLAEALGRSEDLKNKVVDQLKADTNFVRYDDKLALECERHPGLHLHAGSDKNVTVEANVLASPFVRWTLQRVPPK